MGVNIVIKFICDGCGRVASRTHSPSQLAALCWWYGDAGRKRFYCPECSSRRRIMKPESKLMCAIFGKMAEESSDDDYRQDGLRDALVEALDSLAPLVSPAFRERYKSVILMRFGFLSPDGRGRTLEEVGKEFSLTRERIHQIEVKTLRLLRHPSRSQKLREFILRGKKTEDTRGENR